MSTEFDEACVRACQDMWDKAMKNTDAELLGSLFAEDGIWRIAYTISARRSKRVPITT